MIKEPPYILKESGYAGFILPIDIYFKCRDETKKVTYTYDLNLQTTGTFTNMETKTHMFKNPSDEFRRKLLKGGGQSVMNERAPSGSHNDEKSRESIDDRSQLISKPKLGGSSSGGGTNTSSSLSTSDKKYKSKSDESKFASLFGSSGGPGNTKNKVSPDPKSKASPSNFNSGAGGGSSGTGSGSSKHLVSGQKNEKLSSSARSGADKSDKDKKDKSKHSPMKEVKDGAGGNKKDEKHDRREEKKKEKQSKERDRSKDKLKRPPSPKARSPKQQQTASPIIKTVNPAPSTGKDDVRSSGTTVVSSASSVSAAALTSAERPGSSAKKSKKDKKEKDRSSSNASADRTDRKEHKSERPSSKLSDKASKKEGSITPKDAATMIKEKPLRTESKVVAIPDSTVDGSTTAAATAAAPPLAADSVTKQADALVMDKKPDKDSERKHKHKKKDKNKDRDASSSNKDRKKEKSSKNKEDPPAAPTSAPVAAQATSPIIKKAEIQVQSAPPPPPQKSNPLDTFLNEINDKVSIDSDDGGGPNTNSKYADSTPSAAAEPVPIRTNDDHPNLAANRPTKRGRKDTTTDLLPTTTATGKDDKKRKRKSKEDSNILEGSGGGVKRKTPSPANVDAVKIYKKDNDQQSNNSRNHDLQFDHHRSSPATVAVPQMTRSPQQPQLPPPPRTTTPVNRSATSPIPLLAQHIVSTSNNQQQQPGLEYMSELRNLQHKIMTLQDNNELQQVVEMIAETGCYEITSQTFDFDLCALDRSIVQRLQDFFAPSCS